MKLIILIISFMTLQIAGVAQQLAAFNDNLNRFWIFDGGIFKQLEHLEIQEYQVGGILIAYIDNGSNLKVYQNGKVKTLMTGNPIQFTATDYLLGYSIYQQLNVYDNGDERVLSTQAVAYRVSDSLIAWYEDISRHLKVYYNGRTYIIEDGLVFDPLTDFKISSNMLVYHQKISQQLKAFYQGEVLILDDFIEKASYEAGRDIVAYIDHFSNQFKVFFRGEKYTLEPFRPKSFIAGNESVAYIDNLGKLKFFVRGELLDVTHYEPQFYDLKDNILIYEEQGFFKTFCNGQTYVIERYIPSIYKMGWNTIAYLDQNQFIQGFYPCEKITFTHEKVNHLQVIRDLVIYVVGINKTKVYFMGQVFEH